MAKRLTRHGNSLALVIERPILRMLGIGANTPLDVSTDGRRLIITPTRERRSPGKAGGGARRARKK